MTFKLSLTFSYQSFWVDGHGWGDQLTLYVECEEYGYIGTNRMYKYRCSSPTIPNIWATILGYNASHI